MAGAQGRSLIRRLDHVAVAVHDTEAALRHFRDRLGLRVVASEDLAGLDLRLTYLDAGNTYLQLVEPLNPDSPIADWLGEHGEGLHHICFGVDDVQGDLAALAPGATPSPLGHGRGRAAGFLPEMIAGVRIECTEFQHDSDVAQRNGWIETSPD